MLPVNPVIVVEGLATNITITNLSTNTSITYTGTVDENQTLVIDCYNQTAKLNGANVVSNISGDWIQIVNGVNRFQLSIGSGTTDHAVLKWNEVVG